MPVSGITLNVSNRLTANAGAAPGSASGNGQGAGFGEHLRNAQDGSWLLAGGESLPSTGKELPAGGQALSADSEPDMTQNLPESESARRSDDADSAMGAVTADSTQEAGSAASGQESEVRTGARNAGVVADDSRAAESGLSVPGFEPVATAGGVTAPSAIEQTSEPVNAGDGEASDDTSSGVDAVSADQVVGVLPEEAFPAVDVTRDVGSAGPGSGQREGSAGTALPQSGESAEGEGTLTATAEVPAPAQVVLGRSEAESEEASVPATQRRNPHAGDAGQRGLEQAVAQVEEGRSIPDSRETSVSALNSATDEKTADLEQQRSPARQVDQSRLAVTAPADMSAVPPANLTSGSQNETALSPPLQAATQMAPAGAMAAAGPMVAGTPSASTVDNGEVASANPSNADVTEGRAASTGADSVARQPGAVTVPGEAVAAMTSSTSPSVPTVAPAAAQLTESDRQARSAREPASQSGGTLAKGSATAPLINGDSATQAQPVVPQQPVAGNALNAALQTAVPGAVQAAVPGAAADDSGDNSSARSTGLTSIAGSGANSAGVTLGVAATAAATGADPGTRTGSVAQELARRLQNPAWGRALGQRAVMMAQYGPRTAEIQLDPPELGALQVRVHLSGQDQVSVSFSSPHAQVREALEQQLPRLREMFAEQGLNLGQSSVSDQSGQQSGERSAAMAGRAAEGNYGQASEVAGSESATLVRVPVGLVDYYA